MIVNGREYPLWSQFVERKDEYINKTLFDYDSERSTNIVSITLTPNGKDSAFFSIEGKDFNCGFDVQYGGINPENDGLITFFGYGGHKFKIS